MFIFEVVLEDAYIDVWQMKIIISLQTADAGG